VKAVQKEYKDYGREVWKRRKERSPYTAYMDGGGDKVTIQTTGPELWNSPPADPRQADSLTLLVCHQIFKDIISEMIYVEWDEVKPYSNQPKPVACTSASIVSSTQQASTSTPVVKYKYKYQYWVDSQL